MAIAESKSAEVVGAGTTDFVPLGPEGAIVTVDAVDADGNSSAFGSASVSLLYSPDGKMQGVAVDPTGVEVSGKTDGFSREMSGPGYVAASRTGAGSERIKISVVDIKK